MTQRARMCTHATPHATEAECAGERCAITDLLPGQCGCRLHQKSTAPLKPWEAGWAGEFRWACKVDEDGVPIRPAEERLAKIHTSDCQTVRADGWSHTWPVISRETMLRYPHAWCSFCIGKK